MAGRAYDNYVAAVKEEGSLTRAAVKLGISQPAISAGLTALERQVGFKIFHRDTVPVTLTEAGAIYVNYIERQQLLKLSYERQLGDLLETSNRQLSVGGPAVYMDTLLVRAAAAFVKADPGTALNLKTASLQDLISDTLRGDLEMFISTTDDLPARFESEPILEEKLCLFVPEAFAVEGADDPALAECPFIYLYEGQPLQERLMTFAAARDFVPIRSVTTDQVMTAVSLAEAGIGVAVATVTAGTERKGLKVFPVTGEKAVRKVYAAWDREQYLTETARSFLAILKEQNQ